MIFQPEPLQRITRFLTAHGIPYMLIGGIANAIWGRVRATADVDLKVLTGGRPVSDLRALIAAEFPLYRRPWLGPAESALIISLEVTPGMVVDLLVGVFPYEEQAVERAITIQYEGAPLRICTAEDLIIHKAIADRQKDWTDIDGIVWRQKGRLDAAYVRYWLQQWGDELEKPHLLARFNQLISQANE
jgi:predicted nucleotidyltransferase